MRVHRLELDLDRFLARDRQFRPSVPLVILFARRLRQEVPRKKSTDCQPPVRDE